MDTLHNGRRGGARSQLSLTELLQTEKGNGGVSVNASIAAGDASASAAVTQSSTERQSQAEEIEYAALVIKSTPVEPCGEPDYECSLGLNLVHGRAGVMRVYAIACATKPTYYRSICSSEELGECEHLLTSPRLAGNPSDLQSQMLPANVSDQTSLDIWVCHKEAQ